MTSIMPPPLPPSVFFFPSCEGSLKVSICIDIIVQRWWHQKALILEEYIEGCITRFNVMLRKCAILSLQGGAVTFLCSGSVEYFLFPVL